MVFSHIHSSNDKSEINKLNTHINQGKPAFVLIFMEGCGPCNITRPEWGKLKNVLPKDENVLVADVDQTVLDQLTSIKEKPLGFPTMLYIEGNQVENYEGGRTITDFVKWIQGKKKMEQKGGKSRKSRRTKKSKKRIRKFSKKKQEKRKKFE